MVFIVSFHWGAYGMLGATAISNFICAVYIFLKRKSYFRENNYHIRNDSPKMFKKEIILKNF